MIIPAQDYILLTVEKKAEEKTAGGIYLPEKTADTSQCGTVAQDKEYDVKYFQNGNGGGKSSLVFKKGVKVWFKRWAGEPIGDYLLVHLKDIVATEEKE